MKVLIIEDQPGQDDSMEIHAVFLIPNDAEKGDLRNKFKKYVKKKYRNSRIERDDFIDWLCLQPGCTKLTMGVTAIELSI
jgi:hypothetical protein